MVNFGVKPFNDKQKALALSEAVKFAKRQMRPAAVFGSLAEYLRSHRIELPTYHALAAIITGAFKVMNTELESLIDLHLSETGRKKLHELLSPQNDSETENAARPYLITRIKRSQEVMRPRAIKANIEDYLYLKSLYHEFKPLLLVLNLSDEMIAYYAQFVIRAQVFQVSRQENRKHLMLICFIVYQYHFLGDLLIETLLKASQQMENSSQQAVKEAIYEKHLEAQGKIDDFMETTSQMVKEAKRIETVTLDFGQTNEQKVAHYIAWVNSDLFRKFTGSQKEIDHFKKGTHATKDATYYQILEEKSRKLQARVAAILRHVDFEIKDKPLKVALADFKKKDGRLADNPPDGFLKKQEQHVLKSATAQSSLYKVFLTQHITKGLKSGRVNLTASFLHKPFLKYLIDEITWDKEKKELLKKANLEGISDWKTIENDVKDKLGKAFAHTFRRIDSGENKFVGLRKDGKPNFSEPKTEHQKGVAIELFPSEGMIPIIEVLNTVNDKCSFTDALQHWNVNGPHASGRTTGNRPNSAVFLAGLMAYGCNIGVGPMARNSQNIAANTLDNTINWYFSLENIQKANDAIVDLMGRLKIGNLFRKDPKTLHTSSDGQKFYVQVDSIHANYSFKYFGKEKGIVIYSFIDEMHRLFYSTSFSSSHREAPYVIDGLMYNQVVETDIHSTDTHGFTEAIFALTHLLGIQFAPRIADFQNLVFYPFPEMEVETLETYDLKIGKPVNTGLIEEYWDQILRLTVSVKLKHTTASTVLKRLNSYARQNPLYQAIKEFGKGIRTLFLLRYMDDQLLRQRINQQNNKTENSHQFSRAVFYANSGKIRFASRQEHLVTDASKRLIQNAVICWNYLYLSKSIIDAPVEKRKDIINAIKKTSPVSWSHVNLHGKFDFSEDALGNAETFDLEKILNLEFDK